MKKNILLAGIILAITFSACKKTNEVYKTDTISEFAPLEVGKYITYQLDSLIYADNVNPVDRINTYQVKHVVEDTTTDNLGRKGYTIRRYIRKTANDVWVTDNVFVAINTGNSLEFIENNFRFIKLKEPIKNNYTWKGNSYIDTNPVNTDLNYLEDWDYTYDSLNTPLHLGTITVDSTLKVAERDEVQGNPNDPGAIISVVNFSVSNYGRGIGLIYHRFNHREYQNSGGTGGYIVGYGITLTMIDHN